MSTREQAIKQAEIDYAYAVREMREKWTLVKLRDFGSSRYATARADYGAAVRRMSAVACRLHTLKQTVNQEETICTF